MGKNIATRNKKIENGENKTDFYVTEGLKKKLLENWETPNKVYLKIEKF